MKKFLAVVLSMLITISVVGCSEDENAPSAASSSTETSEESSSSFNSGTEADTVSASDPVSSDASSEASTDSNSASSDAEPYALPAGSSAVESAPTSSAQTGTQQTEVSRSEASSASINTDLEPDSYSGSSISQEEYDKIQDGMTYEQAEKIIGGSGRLQSKFGTKGTSFYTVVYRWKGHGSKDAYADLTFQDGKLIMKIQFGLE